MIRHLDRPQSAREHLRMMGNDYLDPRTRAELERRGVENVRLLIANNNWTGVGEGAEVMIGGSGIPRPSRGQVEQWLSEKARDAAKEEKRRHDQVVFWAVAATVAGILGILVTAVQWIWPR